MQSLCNAKQRASGSPLTSQGIDFVNFCFFVHCYKLSFRNVFSYMVMLYLLIYQKIVIIFASIIIAFYTCSPGYLQHY